jgi:hypothetical protein
MYFGMSSDVKLTFTGFLLPWRRCSLNPASFLKPDAGEPNSQAIGTGRSSSGNGNAGHFQGPARQLTSSAVGRAILWSRAFAASTFTQMKTQL